MNGMIRRTPFAPAETRTPLHCRSTGAVRNYTLFFFFFPAVSPDATTSPAKGHETCHGGLRHEDRAVGLLRLIFILQEKRQRTSWR